MEQRIEHRNEWEEVVPAEFACPECGERRMDYLVNDEGHVTCESCGYEYDIEHLTFTVKNPWSGELVEISESEVTQEKLDFLATLMDDEIRESIHNSEDCPETPGSFFARYAKIVGAEEAGRIWFA